MRVNVPSGDGSVSNNQITEMFRDHIVTTFINNISQKIRKLFQSEQPQFVRTATKRMLW